MSSRALNPLVDSDYLVYRVGFAVKEGEPLEFALSTVKHAIQNIWDKFPDHKHHSLFLTGKGNFRNKVATTAIYKGNRDPANKPFYYSEIREYMIAHQSAQVVDGMEAEDAAGIQQYASKDRDTVIVGVDKDLLCIPGWHYNPVKDTMMYVTLPEANENFWKQVLTGDRTDNIIGLEGIGPVKAGKIITPCHREWQRMRDATLAAYRNQFGNDAERAMTEVANLIWILRKDNEGFDGRALW